MNLNIVHSFPLCFLPSWWAKPLHNPGLVGNTRPVGLLTLGEDVPRPRQPGGSNVAFRSEF